MGGWGLPLIILNTTPQRGGEKSASIFNLTSYGMLLISLYDQLYDSELQNITFFLPFSQETLADQGDRGVLRNKVEG